MKTIVLCSICVILSSLFISSQAYDSCENHPLRDYSVTVWKVTNKGLTCLVDGIFESGCFEETQHTVSDYFTSDNKPTSVNASSICSDIKNSCIDSTKIDKYKSVFGDFVNEYHQSILNIFNYDVNDDTQLRACITSLIGGIYKLIRNHCGDVVSGAVSGVLSTDKLLPYVQDGFNFVFGKISDVVVPLIDSLDGLWNNLDVFAKGMSCAIADADLDEKAKKYLDGKKLSIDTSVFNRISSEIKDAINNQTGALNKWINSLVDQVIDFYKKLVSSIDDVIGGINGIVGSTWNDYGGLNGFLKQFLDIDVEQQIRSVFNTSFLDKAADNVVDCIFPSTKDGYCVPLLDEIIWLVNGLDHLFSGDFVGFFGYITSGFDRDTIRMSWTSDKYVTVRSKMIADIRTLSVPNVEVTDNGYDVTERAAASTIVTSRPSSNKGSGVYEIFGYELTEQELIQIGAGVIGFALLLIICCCCCCKKKKANRYRPPPVGPMSNRSSPPSFGARPPSGLSAPSVRGGRYAAPSMRGRGPSSVRGVPRGRGRY